MKSVLRRIALVVVTTGLVACLAAVAIDYATRPVLIAGPMLQLVEPGGFTVVWWATRTTGGALEVTRPGHAAKLFPAAPAGSQRLVARVVLDGPADEIDYRVVQRSRLGVPHRMGSGHGRLAKRPEESLRFIAFGDSGSGKTAQYDLGAAMPAFKPDLVIHTGDLVYSAGRWADYGPRFFQPYGALIRDVPFYPSFGNHDLKTDEGKPLLFAFELPENGPPGLPKESNYWFDCGPARFVAVNSCEPPWTLHETTAPWLESVLASAGTRWRFVFFHNPPYTGSKHHPDARVQEALVPVMESNGVDVVFCGHNHLYERTKALRGGRVVADGEGIFYVLTGAGGGNLYAERNPPPDYIAAFTKNGQDDFGFTVVEVAGDTLRLKHINRLGEVADEWTHTRRPTTRPATGTAG